MAGEGKVLRALVVEDREDDALLLVRLLQREGYAVRWRRVDGREALREALEGEPWDVVLCDFRMPGFDARQALEVVRAHDPDMPFVVVSGTVGEDVAVEMMRAGANDYVMKDNLTRLPAAVTRELREADERRARRWAEAQLRRLSLAVEQGPGIVIVTNAEGRVEYVNRRFTEVTGFEPQDVVGTPAYLLAEPLDPSARAALQEALGSGAWWRGEALARRKDGSTFFAVFTVSAVREPDGRVVHHVVIAEDVTPLKEAEARERELRRKLERQLGRLKALRTVDIAITASLDLRVVLDVILDQVTTELGLDAASVLLRDGGPALRVVAARGLGEERTRPVAAAGEVGRAVLGGERVQVSDLREASGTRERALAEAGFVGYCALPLVAKGTVLGALEVLSTQRLPEDPEWWSFLDALAGQLAVAVDNARLVEGLRRANLELQLAYDATLEGWSRALDLRDRDTEGHTQRVAELTVRLARAVGVPEPDLVHVRRGALLHDIGKLGIPDGILLKPGPLTEEEWAVMRQHPEYAYRWLSGIEFLRPALDIPYCHHERWDGAGYPRGLKGEEIPLAARIFAVVDVFDALTSDRPYREAWSQEEAVRYIREQAGVQFDPRVVETFLELVARGEWP
ncbi:Cyclic di-GMP phosphodiesterase response regulator RpfG [bacterium HR32]|nr:Cyclic di-GMP phosphodiesterase response regulator RpfG [bacterium HR32]